MVFYPRLFLNCWGFCDKSMRHFLRFFIPTVHEVANLPMIISGWPKKLIGTHRYMMEDSMRKTWTIKGLSPKNYPVSPWHSYLLWHLRFLNSGLLNWKKIFTTFILNPKWKESENGVILSSGSLKKCQIWIDLFLTFPWQDKRGEIV